jgi:hypothetical protein
MTALAQRVATETTQDNQGALLTVNPGDLTLNQNNPASGTAIVFVYALPGANNKTISGFALPTNASTAYTGNLLWSTSSDSLSISFVFIGGSVYAKSITYDENSGLHNSTACPQNGYGNSQQCVGVPHADATCNFTVNFSNGQSQDPKIVVTPL